MENKSPVERVGPRRREYVTLAEAELLRGHLKRCRITSATAGSFYIFSDEPETAGGALAEAMKRAAEKNAQRR